MKDYEKMFNDLFEEISIIYESIIYKNLEACKNEVENEHDIIKYNYCIDKLYHLLNYANILNLKYGSNILEVLNYGK